MALNPLDIIKRQIEAQTKAKLNLELSNRKTTAVDASNESPSIPGGAMTISPQWVRGSYTLIRGSDLIDPITPDSFRNYSGSIQWQNINTQAVIFNGLDRGSNNMFGVQVYAVNNTTKIPLTFFTDGGVLGVYTKGENENNFSSRHTSVSGGYSKINIEIGVGTWTTVIVTFYSESAYGNISFGADFVNMSAWRPLDITSPSMPTWANTNPSSYQIVQGDVKRGKVTLKWEKDSSIDFGGNGIYKQSYVGSGQTVSNSLPGTLFDTLFRVATEKNKWLVIDHGATINIGDVVTFDSLASTGTVRVSDVKNISANMVPNSIFRNGNTHWSFSSGTIKSDVNSAISAHHWHLPVIASLTRYTLVSGTIDIGGNGTLLYMGMMSSHDLMSDRHFGIGGYGSTPSLWKSSGGISIVATRQGVEPILRVARTTALGSIRSSGSHLYLTTAATYQINCIGSFESPTEYRVVIRNASGDSLYSSPTVYATAGRNSADINMKPSAATLGYFELNVLATTSSVGTIDFSRFSIVPIKDTTDHSEFLEVLFYDSVSSPCATPRHTKEIRKNKIVSSEYVALGSADIPSSCKYIRLAYTATLGNDRVQIARRVFGMFVTNNLIPDTKYDVFATPYTLLRLSDSVSVGTPNVYFTKSEHVIDRPRQADDGTIVSWDDYDIDNNSTYIYKLDSYDNSAFKNRSGKTSEQSVLTGDTTSPLAPSGFALTGYAGGISYTWANPTASDFMAVRIYSDASLTGLLFEQYGSSGATMSLTEFAAEGTVSRWAQAVDMWGNTSASVAASVMALPTETSDIGFQVVYRTGGNVTNLLSADWVNTSVTASIAADTGVAVASYLYSYHVIELASILPRFTAWTDFNGAFELSSDYRYVFRFKVKDINGHFSNIKEFEVNVDTKAPRIIDEDAFWQTSSRGGVNYNKLTWDNTQISERYDSLYGYSSTWERSGLSACFIERAEVDQLTPNPFFAYGQVATLDGWYQVDADNTAVISSYTEDSFYGVGCAKVTVSASTLLTRLRSEVFSANAGDALWYMCRVKGSIANCTINLQITDSGTSNIKVIPNSLQTTATWQYISGTLSVTTTGEYRLNIVAQDVTGASAGDYFLIDELFCSRNASFSTIAEVPPETSEYTDYDVIPWSTYLYRAIFKDSAGNYSSYLPCKLSIPVADVRDLHRNMLDNSSFERTYRMSSGTLQAHGWDNSTYGTAVFSKETPTKINEVKLGDAFNGSHYVEIGDSVGADMVFQNDIHLLPSTEPGILRKYVYSVYLRSANSGYASGVVYIAGRDNQTQAIVTKSDPLSASIPTVWTRFTGTFQVATASVSNISFGIVSLGDTIHVDACQLEEKDTLPATEYYDTKSLTADYLQGVLIRGHMIEANSIYAENIQANTITASQMNLSSVDVFKTEKNGHIVASATPYATCRMAVAETPSERAAAFESPYIFIWGGLRKEQTSGTFYVGFGVKDYNMSNQGLVWATNLFTGAPSEIRSFATLCLRPLRQYTPTEVGAEALLGLHTDNSTLWVVAAYENRKASIAGPNGNLTVGVYSVDVALTGGDNAISHGTIYLDSEYGMFDGVERYNLLAKSEHIGGGTFAILHCDYKNGERADNIYLSYIKQDGTLVAGPSLIVGSLMMGGTGQVRQTFMGKHPTNNNLVVGCYKSHTATLFYKVVDDTLTEVTALASTSIFSPYPRGMSIHGGDIICAAGSLIHWMFTGDASSTHGYCVSDFNGNIIVEPHIKWSLDDEVETRVWSFDDNISTWGQPVVKEERGMLLPDGSLFYYMGYIPPATDFSNTSAQSWMVGLGTLPAYVQGLIVHKTVKYSFASISLESLFNRLR